MGSADMRKPLQTSNQMASIDPSTLASLRDRDLMLLMNLAMYRLDNGAAEDAGATQFWIELVDKLEVEVDRRLEEIQELERLYFLQ